MEFEQNLKANEQTGMYTVDGYEANVIGCFGVIIIVFYFDAW